MAFLSVCIYASTYFVAGFVLTLIVDGKLPSGSSFGDETLGFNGIMIGLAMMPEHFALIPHTAKTQRTDANPNLIPFCYRISPANAVFLTAIGIGLLQSVVVFFLWRFATTSTQFNLPNIICGILTFCFVVFGGVLLASVAGKASALLSADDDPPHRRKRSKTNR